MSEKKKNSMVWPIGIMVTYGIFMLFMFSYFAFSQSIGVDLIADNYYEQQIAYQNQIDRLERTNALPVRPQIFFDAGAQEVNVVFDHSLRPDADGGRIMMVRPSNAAMDFAMPLRLNADGVQKFKNLRLRTGLWKAKIQWEMDSVEYFMEETIILP